MVTSEKQTKDGNTNAGQRFDGSDTMSTIKRITVIPGMDMVRNFKGAYLLGA